MDKGYSDLTNILNNDEISQKYNTNEFLNDNIDDTLMEKNDGIKLTDDSDDQKVEDMSNYKRHDDDDDDIYESSIVPQRNKITNGHDCKSTRTSLDIFSSEFLKFDENEQRKLFTKDLYNFMSEISRPITKVPSLGFQSLDLYKLYKLVIARGGMDSVTKQQSWKSVYIELGLSTMSTSASYNTRTNYKKYLYLYELEHFKSDDSNSNKFLFDVSEYIKIHSNVQDNIYYAQIVRKRSRDGENSYYVHYNDWSIIHDEWMPESVLTKLNSEENQTPQNLINPIPSRSSKSNYLISDIHDTKFIVPRKKKLIESKSSNRRYSSSSEDASDTDVDLLIYLLNSQESEYNTGDNYKRYRSFDNDLFTVNNKEYDNISKLDNKDSDTNTSPKDINQRYFPGYNDKIMKMVIEQQIKSNERGRMRNLNILSNINIDKEREEREMFEKIPLTQRDPSPISEYNIDFYPLRNYVNYQKELKREKECNYASKLIRLLDPKSSPTENPEYLKSYDLDNNNNNNKDIASSDIILLRKLTNKDQNSEEQIKNEYCQNLNTADTITINQHEIY